LFCGTVSSLARTRSLFSNNQIEPGLRNAAGHRQRHHPEIKRGAGEKI